MTTGKSYVVTLKRRWPFISKFLHIVFIISAIFLVLFFFFPDVIELARAFHVDTSGLLKASRYMLPLVLIGTLICGPLYFAARRRMRASLTFQRTGIAIVSEKENLYISYSSIVKILCSDLTTWRGGSKQQLQIVIRQKGRRVTSFRLADYSEADDVIQELSSLEGIPIHFYEKAFIEDDEQENAWAEMREFNSEDNPDVSSDNPR